MRRLLVISALLLCCVLPMRAQGSQGCLPQKAQNAFRGDEKLTLSLQYKWGAVNTDVATAVVQLDSVRFKGTPAYHCAFTVKSAPFFDLFFKMREDFQSWFTIDGLRPLKFSRNTSEGDYTATNLYLYDWQQKVIHADIRCGNNPAQSMDIPLHDCVYDLPTLIFYLRNADFSKMKVGQSYPLSFAIDDAVFDIRLTYKGEELMKARRLGKVKVRHFSCSVVSGAMFEGNQELQFWLSADEDALPVAVMAPLRVGAVWARLKAFENVKHGFTALQR